MYLRQIQTGANVTIKLIDRKRDDFCDALFATVIGYEMRSLIVKINSNEILTDSLKSFTAILVYFDQSLNKEIMFTKLTLENRGNNILFLDTPYSSCTVNVLQTERVPLNTTCTFCLSFVEDDLKVCCKVIGVCLEQLVIETDLNLEVGRKVDILLKHILVSGEVILKKESKIVISLCSYSSEFLFYLNELYIKKLNRGKNNDN